MAENENQQLQPKPTVETNSLGLLAPKSIEEAFRLASAYHKSGLLPARYKSPEMILVSMQFAIELGLRPLTAMRQIAVVNGTPSIFGDLPLALCYSSGKLESIREALFDKSGNEISLKNKNLTAEAFGAWCVVKRKGDPETIERAFTMDDAARAGLGNSPTWKAYPKRMLMYRARSQALKDKFPDALNGVSIAEFDHDVLPDTESEPINVTRPDLKTTTGKAAAFTEKLNKPAPINITPEATMTTPTTPPTEAPAKQPAAGEPGLFSEYDETVLK